ncbi:MAG: FHA domain-containing protein [Lachnospiraceae bacterium]|nr:FHA domain-containing protein [Lachnospiraceae bacterium]
MNFKFKQQSVGETTYLIFEVDDNLEIDSFAMRMMANNRFTNIVQTQIVRINEKRQIQFNVTGLLKLNSRISIPRPKREVLGIFNSILNAFEEVDAYMLDMDHLFLEWEYIYLDGQGNCMLMYLPFDHTFSKDKIDFLQEVVNRVQPDYQEKDTYLFDIQNSFSRGAIQKLSDFREVIKKSANISDVGYREEKQEQAMESRPELPVKPQEKEGKVIKAAEPEAAEKKQGKKPAVSPKAAPSRIPVINIPGREPGAKEVPRIPVQEPVKKEPAGEDGEDKKEGKKKWGIFGKTSKHKKDEIGHKEDESRKLPPSPKSAPDYGAKRGQGMYESYEHTVIMPEPVMPGSHEGTVILEQPEFAMQSFAKLVSRQDGREYRIDKDKMTIGSGAAADIRINNNAISRSHAVIFHECGNYFIEDTQSRNGTFIGGRRIQAGVREPLYDEMLLKLANEDFAFIKD